MENFMFCAVYGPAFQDLRLNYWIPEAATQRCSLGKMFWKYAANLQDNTHAKVRFP